jgi:hypothetical protein
MTRQLKSRFNADPDFLGELRRYIAILVGLAVICCSADY